MQTQEQLDAFAPRLARCAACGEIMPVRPGDSPTLVSKACEAKKAAGDRGTSISPAPARGSTGFCVCLAN